MIVTCKKSQEILMKEFLLKPTSHDITLLYTIRDYTHLGLENVFDQFV